MVKCCSKNVLNELKDSIKYHITCHCYNDCVYIYTYIYIYNSSKMNQVSIIGDILQSLYFTFNREFSVLLYANLHSGCMIELNANVYNTYCRMKLSICFSVALIFRPSVCIELHVSSFWRSTRLGKVSCWFVVPSSTFEFRISNQLIIRHWNRTRSECVLNKW